MKDTDARLIERARAGDSAAFELLVRRHLHAAYMAALAVTEEPADAEDVCQDAFITALERLEECRQPERFAAWLLRIVRNRALSLKRYQEVRRAQPIEEAALAATREPSPVQHAEIAELRERLRAGLGGLTNVQREVVVLHDMEGWRHREIADLLGLAEGTVRAHLFYARRALRERLGYELCEGY